MFLTNKFLFLLALVCSFEASADGISSSGTGSVETFETNPWFIGDDVVNYCVQTSDGISLDGIRVQQVVRSAIEDWVSTLKSVKPEYTGLQLPDGKRKTLSTRFSPQACDETTDLVFKIGVFDAQVEQDLAHLPVRTIGFAQMLQFQHKSGRARGYIWITPDQGPRKYIDGEGFWKRDNALYAVLLHELGHVFGIKHQSRSLGSANYESLMSADYPQSVLKSDGNRNWNGTIRPVTSKELFLSSWVRLNSWDRLSARPQYCGEIRKNFSENILDVDKLLKLTPNHKAPEGVYPLYYACLIREGLNSGDGSIPVRLVILEPSGLVHKEYWISPRTVDFDDTEVLGRYTDYILDGAPRPVGNTPYRHTYLFTVNNYRVVGKTIIDNHKAAVLIEGNGLTSKVTFFIDGESTNFNIDWQPDLHIPTQD